MFKTIMWIDIMPYFEAKIKTIVLPAVQRARLIYKPGLLTRWPTFRGSPTLILRIMNYPIGMLVTSPRSSEEANISVGCILFFIKILFFFKFQMSILTGTSQKLESEAENQWNRQETGFPIQDGCHYFQGYSTFPT